MSGRRFFVEPTAVGEERISLSAELVHHIVRVLRLSVGEEILLLDGLGNHYLSCLETLSPTDGWARIVKQWHASETSLQIQLIQALPKGEKFDLILQKGTELGISRFSPVFTERSVPVMNQQRAGKKQTRWQRIVTEAARQSRRAILPICDPVASLAETLNNCRQQLKLMLWEDGSLPLAEQLPEKPPENVAVLVGPEGGFSPQEAELAEAAGFLPVCLGPRILRTETAGFAVTAILEYLYGDFGVGNNAVN
jgi:16S rRNA (uracil1498-N3)-methyltransferase